MILIPAIDLLGGRCVRLLQGDYDKVTEYGADPVAMAKTFEDGGSSRLHLVDLDGAKEGEARNAEIILEVAKALGIPLEVGGGIRTREQVEIYLEGGVDRAILGTVAFRNPDLLEECSQAYPGRVWVAIDSKEGKVAVEGWIEETETDAYELAKMCEDRGAGGVIFTDIARDGMLSGPNLESLAKMAESVGLPLIASGGISSVDDLAAIRGLGVDAIEGIISGKALYSEAISLEEALRAVEG